MTQRTAPPASWVRYLLLVTTATICFGAVLVLAPGPTEALFGHLTFGRSGFPATFSTAALDYIRLAHAVLGAEIVGWFALVLWVVRFPLANGLPGAWHALVLSLAAWYVPDTAYSLLAGYWPNAALNTGILLAFLPGLAGTRPPDLTKAPWASRGGAQQ